MTVAGVFAAITAALKLIPIVDVWVQRFIAFYVNSAINRMQSENIAAIKKAVEGRDQRDLEKALGNPNAGEASGFGDVRDFLPGMPKPPGN